MPHYKHIVGEKCYLSPPDPGDADKYCRWLMDMEIMKNLEYMYLNEEREKALLSDLMEDSRIFGIVENISDKLIGATGLHQIDYINRRAMYGIFIGDKSFHGKGFGFEATNLILDYGFNVLNLNSIWLYCYSFNKKALRLYEKMGFKKTGVFRQAKYFAGNYHDQVCMDMLAAEFKSVFINKFMD